MVRISLFVLPAILSALLPDLVAAQIHFTATLTGADVVPPVMTPGGGTGSFELSEDLTVLWYFVSYHDIAAAGGGLYTGAAGTNGTVVKSLIAPPTINGDISGTWRSDDIEPMTPAFVDSLLKGNVYIQLNAGAGGLSGVLRAQVALSTSLHFESVIDGSGELPPVSTTAGGTGVFVLDKSRTRVDYWLTYRGLTGNLSSAAEVRAGAPGATGPVVLEIASAGGPPSATVQGSWTSADSRPLTGALVDSLIAGRLYCNFPTGSHPGGEIRGQLMLKAGIGFVASLDGAQESPPTQTPASGTGSFLLSQDRDRLTYHLTYTGLSGGDSGGSHIHLGAAGETGIVVKTYGPGPAGPEGTIAGVWQAADATEKFSQALAESLITGKLYTNITTGMYSGGEIRGQMNLTTGVGYTSRLSAREDVPPNVVSNGTGTASVVLSPDRQVIAYSLTFHDLTSNISSAGGHFHTGARGFNGGLVKVIVPPNAWGDNTVAGQWSNPDPGSQPLTPAIVDSLIAGHMYINLHTGDYIGGEIRGQLSRDFDVLTSLTGTSAAVPGALHLEQNFPNPFNPATTIRFEIPRASHVTLAVYNMLGQKVATLLDGEKPAGAYTAKFSAAGLGSGVYICRLQAGGLVRTMKLTYLK